MTDTTPRPGQGAGAAVAAQVDSALQGLDEQLAAHQVRDPDGSLRATARSALVVAYGVPEYDVAFAPARGRVAIRIMHSRSGLEALVVELGARTGGDPARRPAHLTGEP